MNLTPLTLEDENSIFGGGVQSTPPGVTPIEATDMPAQESTFWGDVGDLAKSAGTTLLDWMDPKPEGVEKSTYEARKEMFKPAMQEYMQQESVAYDPDDPFDEDFVQATTQKMMDSYGVGVGDSVKVYVN